MVGKHEVLDYTLRVELDHLQQHLHFADSDEADTCRRTLDCIPVEYGIGPEF
jgi:hypothetical protein